jgi:cytochrome c5
MSRFLILMLFSTAAFAQSGEEIWNATCQVCHAEPLSGAPLITDKAAWAPRVAKGKDALYRSALGGFVGPKGNEMPARGGNPTLSDAQVKAAVDYMVSKQGEAK